MKIKIEEEELFPYHILNGKYGEEEIEITEEEYEQWQHAYNEFFRIRNLIIDRVGKAKLEREQVPYRRREEEERKAILAKELTSRKEKGIILNYFGWTQTDTSEWADPDGNKYRLAEAYERCKKLYQFNQLKQQFRGSLKEQLDYILNNWGCANIHEAREKAKTDASLKEALRFCQVLEDDDYGIIIEQYRLKESK